LIREPRALTSSTATFAASSRDSNCVVRADDHRKGGTIKIKAVRNRNGNIPEDHLTYYHSVRLGQSRSDGAGLLLSRMKSGLRSPETDLELAIFSSRLGVAVLSHPPLPKETPSIVAVVRIRGIQ